MAGFRKAKGEQAFLKMGIFGASGSGKTFTSLLVAEGLAKRDKKRIAFIDTEHGSDFYCQHIKDRKVHPEAFDFDALYSKSLTEVIESCKAAGDEYGVIVIDSLSHIWEAAKNSYDGRMTKIGTIPLNAWGKIKKPYKDLINYLMSLNKHVILCGRQGNDFQEDEDTGEMKTVGYKMKAESESPYEPHVLIRLECIKGKNVDSYPVAHVEKDRSGVLAGQKIEYPAYDNIALPIIPYLGKTQAKIETDDETAMQDSEKLIAEEKQKEKHSAELRETYTARFKLSLSKTELDKIAKELTKEVKASMLASDVAALKEEYELCCQKLERK